MGGMDCYHLHHRLTKGHINSSDSRKRIGPRRIKRRRAVHFRTLDLPAGTLPVRVCERVGIAWVRKRLLMEEGLHRISFHHHPRALRELLRARIDSTCIKHASNAAATQSKESCRACSFGRGDACAGRAGSIICRPTAKRGSKEERKSRSRRVSPTRSIQSLISVSHSMLLLVPYDCLMDRTLGWSDRVMRAEIDYSQP